MRGTVEKTKLIFDASTFPKNANQAVLNNVMGYDSIDGNEKGLQNAVGFILERKGNWIKMAMPAGAADLWFKTDNLSYDFDRKIRDIKK